MVDSQAGSTQRVFDCCSFNWLGFAWPALAVCLLVVSIVMMSTGARSGLENLAGQLRDRVTPQVVLAKTDPDRVLIVTSDPSHELAVIATLSPRGYEPLLARNLKSARQQMAAHASKVRFAVLDAAAPDAAAIARTLRKQLPAARIVMLARGSSSEAVGRMLLNRL